MTNKLKMVPFLGRFVEVLGVMLFILMMGSMIVQVIWRYLLNSPIVWIEEFARLVFIWMIYLGAIISMQKGLFYRVDYFTLLLPKNYRIIIEFLINILIFLFLLYLLIHGEKVFYAFEKVRSTALHFPWKYIYFSLVFSSAFMLLTVIINLKESLISIIKVLGIKKV